MTALTTFFQIIGCCTLFCVGFLSLMYMVAWCYSFKRNNKRMKQKGFLQKQHNAMIEEETCLYVDCHGHLNETFAHPI